MDVPSADERLSRTTPTAFTGWALDGTDRVLGVEVILGDGRVIEATTGLPRPDVPVALKDCRVCVDAGWSANIDLATWTGARLRAIVRVRGRRGTKLVITDQVYHLRTDVVAGSVDTSGDITGRVLNVRGRAVVEGRCPPHVDIELDGESVGRARLRLPTGDPETTDARLLFAGFELSVVLDDHSGPVRHTIDALVPHTGTTIRVGARTVTVTPRHSTEAEERKAAQLRAKTECAAAAAVPPRRITGEEGPRLLVFTHQLDLGGGQLYLQELLRQLVPALSACTVVCPTDGELRDELERLGVDVVISGHGLPADHVEYEGQIRQLTALIANEAADAVLVNTLGDFAAVDAATRLGTPTLWAIHESFAVDHWLQMRFGADGPHPYIGERMKRALGAADRLIFESAATSQMFSDHAAAERRSVVPYGVDVQSIVAYQAGFQKIAARRANGIAPDSTVLLCVGTMEERKSQACLVEAFAAVAGRHPDATLVLVGDRPGAYSSSLHRLVGSLGIGRRVRFVPPTRDILVWYALSDVLVSASDIESLPRSMLEAMAFGVPVLSTAVFGIPELIQDDVTGWLYAPRDIEAMTAALERVLSLDPARRAAAGREAQRLVHERHCSTNYGASYTRLIGDLCQTRGEQQAHSFATSATEGALPLGPDDEANRRTWRLVRPYTMTSPARVASLCDAVRHLARRAVPGDIVECGVWRGGSMLAAARTLAECGDTDRTLWLYDTYAGMTPPGDVDKRLEDGIGAAEFMAASDQSEHIWAIAQLDDVKQTMGLCPYPQERLRYVVGPVEETIPDACPREIALLRLDTDWYASTRHELTHLFPRMTAGSVLIIDDYDYWAGTRKAVDEYLAELDVPIFLARIDGVGRMAIVQRSTPRGPE